MRFRRRTTPIISPEEMRRKSFPWGKVIYFGILGALAIGFGIWGFGKLFYIRGQGILEAEAVKVESKLNARIVEIRPGINDKVSKDEPVVFLDKASLQAQATAKDTADVSRKDDFSTYELLEAENRLALVKKERKNQEEWVDNLRGEYDRARRLLALEAITRPQFLEIEQTLKAEERNLSVLSTELRLAKTSYETYKYDTVLIAPISGVVTKIYKKAGEMALRGQPIIAVADPSKFYVKAYFDSADEGKLYVGRKVKIIFANGDKYKGEIRQVYPASHKLPPVYKTYYGPENTPIVTEIDLLAKEPPKQTLGTKAEVVFTRF